MNPWDTPFNFSLFLIEMVEKEIVDLSLAKSSQSSTSQTRTSAFYYHTETLRSITLAMAIAGKVKEAEVCPSNQSRLALDGNASREELEPKIEKIRED